MKTEQAILDFDSILNDTEKKKKRLSKTAVMQIALVVLVIAAVYVWTVFLSDSVAWVFSFGLLGAAVCCTVIYPRRLKAKRKTCSRKVTAVISDCIVNDDKSSDNNKLYYATYSYEFDGIPYRISSKSEYGRKPKKNTEATLMVNPDNPAEIYEVELEKRRIGYARRLGILFFISGIFMLFL